MTNRRAVKNGGEVKAECPIDATCLILDEDERVEQQCGHFDCLAVSGGSLQVVCLYGCTA